MTGRARGRGAARALVVAACVTCMHGLAGAQTSPGSFPFGRPVAPVGSGGPATFGPAPSPAATGARVAPADAPRSLRGRFGLDVAERLLASSQASDRLRGIARAAALGTPEAVALLARLATSEARTDARAMLDLARALAAFNEQAVARTALNAILTAPVQSAPQPRPGAARDTPDEGEHAQRMLMARQVAALALSDALEKQGDPLVIAARNAGPGQAAALYAFAARPPAQITPLASGTLTPPVLRLLGELGDLRALDAVRAASRSTDAATRAAALSALGEMRDMRAVDLARGLAGDPDPRVRIAAAEALVNLEAADRGRAVEALLGQEGSALAGARLAERVQHEGVVKALAARAVASGDPVLRAATIAALGRQTSPEAVRTLVQLLADPMLAADVAGALARSPTVAAMRALEELAARPATRRLAVRAYVVRALVRRERSEPLDQATRALGSSHDLRERTLGAFAAVALGEWPLSAALADPEPRVRRAAAMASRALGTRASQAALLARLAIETDAVTRVVLAPGLLDGDPRGVVTTRALLERLDAGAADAPLAALAIAARGDERESARITALLASRDPVYRAHVAYGLGHSPARDAIGKLASAYRYETELVVRRAVVAALAARTGDAAPERLATLQLAALWDPDRAVRALAARALDGRPAADPALGPMEVALVRVATADGEGKLPAFTGAIVRSDGIAIPVAFDDDGYVLAPGMPPGEARVILAPRLASYEAPAP